MSEPPEQLDDLFCQFLEVCNQAMQAHKDEFPYKHIWEAAEHLQGDSGMHVTLYDDEPKGDYTLRIEDQHIEASVGTDQPPHPGWRINTSYLKKVIENPEEYINEPTKLDWDWLKNRLKD